MHRNTRPINWIRTTRKKFETFPEAVQDRVATALTIAAEGGKADIAKPLKGLGSGVIEIALQYQTNAYRVVYAVEIAGQLWVIHAFQKKSKRGIKTPKTEMNLVEGRLAKLKEELLP